MSGWETGVAELNIADDQASNTGGALRDATNPNKSKFTAEQIAKAGWAQPEKYDYDRYVRGPAPAAGLENMPSEASGLPNGAHPNMAMDTGAGGGALTTVDAEWASNAARYEWKEEYGDVGPRVPELEQRLFHDQFQLRKGTRFEALTLTVTQESSTQIRPIKSFADAGLHPVMLENIQMCEYDRPTPIQAYCIPAILLNHDVIAIAQTGSGKTAAYLIPALSKLMGKAKKLAAPRPNPSAPFVAHMDGVRAEPLILVIAPTRELSVQIFDEARRLCYRSMLRPCVAYGGGPPRQQIEELSRGCDILIGTPGRLIDLLGRGNIVSFRRLRFTIVDEADELVGLDWKEDLNQLIGGGDNNEDADHRYMLFSATFPKEARKLAREYLDVNHIVWCDEENKRNCLVDLIMSLKPARTMIFVNSKRAADLVDDFLFNSGLPSTSIHSDRTQREREDAIRSFKMGRTPLLITTGVAARGLDFSNVMHVINYDLPSVDHGGITEYLHRIGRTARMGNVGMSTSLFNDRNELIGPMLVKVLLECEQKVPDFLDQYKPDEGQPLNFEDASEDEDDAAAGGDAWGGAKPSGGSGETWGSGAPGGGSNDAWGASKASGESGTGWGAAQDGGNADSAWGASKASGESGTGWGAAPDGGNADRAWGATESRPPPSDDEW